MDVPHEVEIQRQVQVPVPVMRQVFVDVPTPVDQPFEQLVHSTRDVHVPVPPHGFSCSRYEVAMNRYRIRARSAVDPRRHVSIPE